MTDDRAILAIASVRTAFDFMISEMEGCSSFSIDQARRERDNAIEMIKKGFSQKFLVDETGKITPLPVIVHCPECMYKETCISTMNGVEPDGFCKWGVRKDGDGDGK